jgi:hypothetical protein
VARPRPDVLLRLAEVLDVPLAFFAAGRPKAQLDASGTHFRSLRSTRLFQRDKAVAFAAQVWELTHALERSHRAPVLATVRQLYGMAFRCGKPSCTRPLYRVNDETGEVILNSQVAHICARSEGDPGRGSRVALDLRSRCTIRAPLQDHSDGNSDRNSSRSPNKTSCSLEVPNASGRRLGPRQEFKCRPWMSQVPRPRPSTSVTRAHHSRWRNNPWPVTTHRSRPASRRAYDCATR